MEPVAPISEPGEITSAMHAADLAERVVDALSTVMHAPRETLRLPLLCLLAEGHVLVEDVPGVGQRPGDEGSRASNASYISAPRPGHDITTSTTNEPLRRLATTSP